MNIAQQRFPRGLLGYEVLRGGQCGYLEYLGPILAILDIIVGTIAKLLTKTVRY